MLSTATVAVVGTASAAWLARAARRMRVVDRIPRHAHERRVIPEPVRRRLVTALEDSGIGARPEEAVQMWLLAALAALVVCVPLGPVFAAAGPAGVLAGAPIALRARRRVRSRLVSAAVPDLLDRVASELRAGGTVVSGIARVGGDGGPLAGDLGRVDRRVRLGASLGDALDAWARERAVPGVPAAAGALALAHEVGGRSADAIEGLATSLRERLGVVAEVRALSAQARASALVVGLGPLAYLGFSALTDPRALRVLVEHPVGRIGAVVGVALEAAGAVWMRRILARAEAL